MTHEGDPRELIPMPADFAQQVAYWRDRARQERAEKTNPERIP